MLTKFFLNLFKSTITKREEGFNWHIIITIILGIVSVIIFEGFLAYFFFVELRDEYGFSSALSAISTVALFYFQAACLFLYTHYLFKKESTSSFLNGEYDMVKKITQAFLDGFHNKS